MKKQKPEPGRERDSERTHQINRRQKTSLSSSRDGTIAAFHRNVGNQAIQDSHAGDDLQAKLKISRPNDRFEREADRVAEQVTARPHEVGEATIADDEVPPSERGTEAIRNRHRGSSSQHDFTPTTTAPTPRINESPVSGRTMGDQRAGESVARSLNDSSAGSPLPPATRSFFEARFGRDFGDVRVHTGREAADLNRSLDARAFTTGRDIYFNEGEYDPNSHGGKRLLAHELAHVVQQQGGTDGGLVQRQDPPTADTEPDPEAVESLESQDREWLKNRIRDRILLSYPKFVDACNAHQRELREMAAQGAATAKLILDVLLAFGTRGFSRAITAAISRGVPNEAPDAVYRAALTSMEWSDEISSAAASVAKETAAQQIQSTIARGEEEQFVQNLKQQMSVALDAVLGQLDEMSDEELVLHYLRYDPAVATLSFYEEEVGRLVSQYQSEVEPIGMDPEYQGIYAVRARWVEGSRWRALALTGDTRYHHVGGRPQFFRWISPEMSGLAIEATESVFAGDGIETIHHANLEPPGDGTVGMFALLDIGAESDLTRCRLVVEPSTGTVSPRGGDCPTCHGESGSMEPPTGPDLPDFGEFSRDRLIQENRRHVMDPGEAQEVIEYLESISEEEVEAEE